MDRDQAQISLISWNINGLSKKIAYVTDEARQRKCDIVFLQETHIGPQNTGVYDNVIEWEKFFTGDRSGSKGVAILIKKHDGFKRFDTHKDKDGSYIIVKCEVRGQDYTLVNMYNHPLETDVLEKIIPYLQESAQGVLVIGGDFNTALNPYMDRTSTTLNRPHAKLRTCVEKFTASLHLVDIWRRINRTERKYTYYKNDCMSRLDYIFMQEESMWRVKDCEILPTPEEYSDHKPVWLQLTSAPSNHGLLPEIDNLSCDRGQIMEKTVARSLAWHLKMHFKDMTKKKEKMCKIRALMVINTPRKLRIKWSLLEEAIKALRDFNLDSIIIDKLLSESEPGWKQLRHGCPLTPALLTLYRAHLATKVQALTILPSGKVLADSSGTLIYGETVMICLPFNTNDSQVTVVTDTYWRLRSEFI